MMWVFSHGFVVRADQGRCAEHDSAGLRESLRPRPRPPRGTGCDLDEGREGALAERVKSSAREAMGAIDLLWKTPSVLARFEGTGVLTAATARAIGLTGPAARASGIG